MCGICGIVSKADVSEGEISSIRRMNKAMLHRGPDGDGEFSCNNAFLAMRRLSIIDLEGGWQPLYSEDKSVAVIANGEIYNFKELREELKAKGHKFSTHSDCESIVHLYEEYGLKFVDHLRGMFAIALWDHSKSMLVIVRDRMGEKPLYLYEEDGRILFASEMKSMLSSGMVSFELEPGAVCDYFHYNYVPEPRTMVRGVRKLPAGHMLIINVDTWQKLEQCYWRMEDAPALKGNPAELIRAQLEDISDIILRSDVPVGIALSAGLDSSTLAVLAAKRKQKNIHALTVGFKGAGWRDEKGPAKELAKHLGIPFHSIDIDLDDMVKNFAENCLDKDDPIADIASYGYYALSKLAHDNNIPVLLQGQGSDEMYWGYTWLRRAIGASMQKFKDDGKPPPDYNPLRSMFPQNLHMTGLRDYAFVVAGKLLGWAKLPKGSKDSLHFYNKSKTYQMGHYATKRIFTNEYRSLLKKHDPSELFTVPQPRPDLGILTTKLACQTYLLENGIAQGDRLAMRSSVELRLPLVDYRMIETIIGLRKSYPDQHLQPKAWFKDAIKDCLPEWVINRPKTGFSPPTSLWMNAVRKEYGNSLLNGYLVKHNIIKPSAALKMIKYHSQLTAWPTTLFKALVLEHWAQGMSKIASSSRSKQT